MAGWTLLLDYIFLPLLSYLLIGIYMSEYFPAVPAAVWVLGSIALVTFLNLIGIESITRVNLLLVVVQLVFIVVFVALSIHNLGDQTEPVSLLAPFHHEGFSVPLIMTGAAVLCLSFLGFDAVSTMAEETPNPRRLIPLAIMVVSLLGGLLFVLVSYFAQMVYPQWNTFADPDSASLDVMRRVGGELLVTAFTATYVAGCFASAMASGVRQAGLEEARAGHRDHAGQPVLPDCPVHHPRYRGQHDQLRRALRVLGGEPGGHQALSGRPEAARRQELSDIRRGAGAGVPKHYLAVDQPVQHVVRDWAVLDGVGAALFAGRNAWVPGEAAGVADGGVIGAQRPDCARRPS